MSVLFLFIWCVWVFPFFLEFFCIFNFYYNHVQLWYFNFFQMELLISIKKNQTKLTCSGNRYQILKKVYLCRFWWIFVTVTDFFVHSKLIVCLSGCFNASHLSNSWYRDTELWVLNINKVNSNITQLRKFCHSL